MNWFWQTPQAQPQAEQTLADYGTKIKDAASTVLSLFDDGFNVYTSVAERMNAIKILNAETTNKVNSLTTTQTPTTTSTITNFFQSQEGLIIAGAIGALFVGMIFIKR